MADSPDRQDRPSRLYGPGSRALQDELDSRRLADRLAELTIHDRLDDGDVALIKDQRTVWVSTVDADGWPDVSYKGGARGFVQVVDPGTLAIPSYDGNGMYRTLGNVSDNGRVALLFVDPERPWRMRVHGRGTVSLAAEDLVAFPGPTPSCASRSCGSSPTAVATSTRVRPTPSTSLRRATRRPSPAGSASRSSPRCCPPGTRRASNRPDSAPRPPSA